MSQVSVAMRRVRRPLDSETGPLIGEGADRAGQFRSIESLQRSAGNAAVGELLRQHSAPGDANGAALDRRWLPADQNADLEAEADQVGAPRKPAAAVGPGPQPAGSLPNDNASTGAALPWHLRRDFESRLGIDLSDVRVHHDRESARGADAVDARAFTVGRNVYFGRNEYAPGTAAGSRLLGHELTHVAQQQQHAGPMLQRQARSTATPALPVIPNDLKQSVDLTKLTDDKLAERHDRILEVIGWFPDPTPDTNLLVDEAAHIGTELARRRALTAGRTFSADTIEQMRAYFEANAKKPSRPRRGSPAGPEPPGGYQDSCIVALNHGMKLATGDKALPTTPDTIEKSMKLVGGAGFTGDAREVWFQQKNGKISRGGARPERLNESLWDTVIGLAGGDPGWSVLTMSVLDGNHSVTLTLDNNDPTAPKVFWSDQWGSKGGWKEYTRATLDAEVTRLVQGWWDEQAEGKKFPPVLRLWRMRATKAAPSRP